MAEHLSLMSQQQGRKPNWNDNEVIKALLETNRQLTEQLMEMSKLIAGINNPPLNIPMTASKDPLMMPESEEDARYLLDNGLINKAEFEDVLQELKFYNTEIIVPTSS